MARQVRDAVLESREARSRLKTQPEPHWRGIDKGLHLGYRKRKAGGSWIVRRFTEAGKYSKHKLGIADDIQDADNIKTLNYKQALKTARAWDDLEIRKEAGLEDAFDGTYTVADAMREYMEHYSVEGKGVKATQSSINAHILPALGSVEVARLTTKKIADWHVKLAISPAMLRTGRSAKKRNLREHSIDDADAVRRRRATSNRIMTILKAALNFAWKEGKIANDAPWRKVKPFKSVDAPVVRYLTENECSRLVNACPSDLRAIVRGALLTGCRYSELVRLVAKDFNPDAGTVTVRLSKSGKVRHIVLTDEGRQFFANAVLNKQGHDIIFTREAGGAWGNSHQKRPIIEACKHAKIKPAISFHVLRHTHGSLLAMKGVPMPVIAKQLGHADTRMTEKHYAHLSPSYVAETIRQNFPKLGIVEEQNVVLIKAKNVCEKPRS